MTTRDWELEHAAQMQRAHYHPAGVAGDVAAVLSVRHGKSPATIAVHALMRFGTGLLPYNLLNLYAHWKFPIKGTCSK